MKLYELTTQYRQLAQQLSDLDLDAGTVADTIEASGLIDDITTKAQGVEMVCREVTKDLPAIEAEIKRLKALAEHRNKVAEGLRAYLLANMQASGITQIDAPLFKISTRLNPPSVEVFDEAQVPSEYMEPKYSVSKTLLKEAMATGKEIPGARMTQTVRLVVK